MEEKEKRKKKFKLNKCKFFLPFSFHFPSIFFFLSFIFFRFQTEPKYFPFPPNPRYLYNYYFNNCAECSEENNCHGQLSPISVQFQSSLIFKALLQRRKTNVRKHVCIQTPYRKEIRILTTVFILFLKFYIYLFR